MVRRTIKLRFACALAAVLAIRAAHAQSSLATDQGTIGAAVRVPAGALRPDWKVGWAGSGAVVAPVTRGWMATGSVEGGAFPAKDFDSNGVPTRGVTLNLLGIALGARHAIGTTPIYAGLSAGYYWYWRRGGDLVQHSPPRVHNGLGIHPTVGLQLGSFDVALLYKFGGNAEWTQIRAGYQFSF